MNTQKAIRLGNELKEELLARKTALRFNNGTFNDLLGRSVPGVFNSNTGPIVTSPEELATYQKNSGHGAQLEDIADTYAKPLIRRMDVLRNQVIPFIDRLAAAIKSGYNNDVYRVPDIQAIEFPTIYNTQVFLEYISKHRPLMNSQIQDIQTQPGHMARNEDDIMRLLRSGNTSLDDALVDMIARYPENWLVDTYTKYMVNGGVIPTALDAPRQHQYIDEIIVLYFIHASLIANNTVDGSLTVSLSQYQIYLAQTFANLGGLLNRYITRIRMVIEGGEVIASYDKQAEIIYVFKDGYDKYLAQGGNADAILGAAVKGLPGSMRTLLANTEALANEYNRAYNEYIGQQKAAFKQTYTKLFIDNCARLLAAEPAEFVALFVKPGTEINPDSVYLDTAIALANNGGTPYVAEIYENTANLIIYGLEHHKLVDLYFRIQDQIEKIGHDPRTAAYIVAVNELISALTVNNLVKVAL